MKQPTSYRVRCLAHSFHVRIWGEVFSKRCQYSTGVWCLFPSILTSFLPFWIAITKEIDEKLPKFWVPLTFCWLCISVAYRSSIYVADFTFLLAQSTVTQFSSGQEVPNVFLSKNLLLRKKTDFWLCETGDTCCCLFLESIW